MLCQCRARNWHSKLLYSGLVWFSILGDYVRGEGGYLTVQHVPCTIQCHTIPVSKYLMVIEPLYSTETIQGTRSSCAAFEFVCICLFPEGSLHPNVDIVLAWSTHLTALYCAIPQRLCLFRFVRPVYPIISQIKIYDQLKNNQSNFQFYILWNVFFILISFKPITCTLGTAFQASCGVVIFIKPDEPPYTPEIFLVYF